MSRWQRLVLEGVVFIAALLAWGQAASGAWGPSGCGPTVPSRRPAGGLPAQSCSQRSLESYTVIQFTDVRGHICFDVVDSRLFNLRKKALGEAHGAAVAAWEKARKEDPSLPRPAEPAVEIIKCGLSGPGARGRASAIVQTCKQRLVMKQREGESQAEASQKPPEG